MSPKQELIPRFQVVLTNSDQLGLPLLYTYEHKFALHSLNNDEMEEVRTDYEEVVDDNSVDDNSISISRSSPSPSLSPGSPPSHGVCRLLQRATG